MSDDNQPSEPIDLDAKRVLAALAQAHRDVKAGDLAPSMVSARLREVEPRQTSSTSIRQELVDAFTEIQRRADGAHAPVPIPSEWSKAIDGGLEPGVHVVVGPTKSGKSTLLSQVAMRAATAGHPVGLVPIELRKRQAVTRLLAESARVSWSDAYRGRLDFEGMRRLTDAVERIHDLPIQFAPMNGPWRASELEPLAAELASMSTEGRVPLIVVDYLQLVKPEEQSRSDLRQCIGEAAYQAHHVAEKHGVAIVLISSAARGYYRLLGGTETESGLVLSADGSVEGEGVLMGVGKESGEIEYSVTTLSVLVRARCADGRRRFALVVAANRYGGARWAPMVQDGWDVVDGTDEDRLRIMAALNPSQTSPSSSPRKSKKQAEPEPEPEPDDDLDRAIAKAGWRA